jgi:hypothetical protein
MLIGSTLAAAAPRRASPVVVPPSPVVPPRWATPSAADVRVAAELRAIRVRSAAWWGLARQALAGLGDGWAEPEALGSRPCVVWQALADSADANLHQQLGLALRADGVPTSAFGALGVPVPSAEAWFAALGECGALRPEPVFVASLARRVGQLPSVGTDAWADAVADALHGAWDTDGSGVLDRVEEVEGVACDVWSALDARAQAEGVDGPWSYTLTAQHPNAFPGVSSAMRSVWDARLSVCGLGPRARAAVATSRPLTEVEVVETMRALTVPNLPAWESEVRSLWIEAFDIDGTLAIDTVDEAVAIPCDAWRTASARVNADTGAPLARWYGLLEGAWEGERLGLRVPVRAVVGRRLAQCRLVATTSSRDPEDRAFDAVLTLSWADAVAALRAPGAFAKRPWTCARWLGLERLAVRELGVASLGAWLGTEGVWRGGEIGRADAVEARAEIARCAMRPPTDRMGAADGAEALGRVAQGLAAAVQASRASTPGGQPRRAIAATGCDVWVSADAVCREAWGAGVDATLGLGTVTGAAAVGVAPQDAPRLHRHLRRCGLHSAPPKAASARR